MKKTFIMTALSALFMLTGCGDLLKPVPEPKQAQYTIDPGVAKVTQRRAKDKTLQVAGVSVAPGYRTKKMAYLRQPHQLEYFTRNQWVAEPNTLLQQPIVDALQKSHVVRQVVGGKAVVNVDYRLLCQLIQLRQNYLMQPSQIELILEATLVDNHNQHIINSQQFSIQQPTPFDTPYGGVLATNQAVNQLQRQIVEFMIQSL